MTITTQQQNALIGVAGFGADYFLRKEIDMIAMIGGAVAAVPAVVAFTDPEPTVGGISFNGLLPTVGGALLAFSGYKSYQAGHDMTAMAAKVASGLILVVQNAKKCWIAKTE